MRTLATWAGLTVALTGAAEARILGVTGPSFSLTAKADVVAMPDGQQIPIWGYTIPDAQKSTAGGYSRSALGRAQYPGPTLIVQQGQTVTITLTNSLAVPTSIVFPGFEVSTSGGSPGAITAEAAGGGGTVTYTFTATEPGTYTYYSGTRPEIEVQMGLFGTLIVRPSQGANRAYNSADTQFDREELFVLSEIDPALHHAVAVGGIDAFDVSTYHPVYWCINGRGGPDTMLPPGQVYLPTQPYSSLARMHIGEKLLMRVVGAGQDSHPFHFHGNHARLIARDGRMLSSTGAAPDLAEWSFTIPSHPGETVDGLFTWTGEGLGWDAFGHQPGDPLQPGESAADHGKPLPVTLPDNLNLVFGGFYSGSPFLGSAGALPPGEGGLNPNSGFAYMWHSHTEKELTNNNVYPGGLLTMLIVEPAGTSIP